LFRLLISHQTEEEQGQRNFKAMSMVRVAMANTRSTGAARLRSGGMPSQDRLQQMSLSWYKVSPLNEEPESLATVSLKL
jgi:hypothetical protein